MCKLIFTSSDFSSLKFVFDRKLKNSLYNIIRFYVPIGRVVLVKNLLTRPRYDVTSMKCFPKLGL
jgi:hypothetical protein